MTVASQLGGKIADPDDFVLLKSTLCTILLKQNLRSRGHNSPHYNDEISLSEYRGAHNQMPRKGYTIY